MGILKGATIIAVLSTLIIFLSTINKDDFASYFSSQHSLESLYRPEGNKSSYFVSYKGLWINTYTYKAKSTPKALVFIVHGRLEHGNSNHYQQFIKLLVDNSFSVYSIDHQGHGKSNGDRGYFEDMTSLANDLQEFIILVCSQYGPEIPFFIFGHELGALISVEMGLRISYGFRGIILSGTLLKSHYNFILENDWGYAVADFVATIFPKLNVAWLEGNLLTNNNQTLRDILISPLHPPNSIKMKCLLEVFRATEAVKNSAELIDWPLLIIHGEDDYMTPSQIIESFYNDVNSEDKTLIVYPGKKQQLLDDVDNEKVLNDVLNWIEKRINSDWDADKKEENMCTSCGK